MGENCTALLFVNVAAFRIGLTLAERFNVQIRAEKTPCGSRAVCVGKNKHQAVWWKPCCFCFALDEAAFRIGLQGWNCLYWRNNSMHRFE